jgi:hypothetical protein
VIVVVVGIALIVASRVPNPLKPETSSASPATSQPIADAAQDKRPPETNSARGAGGTGVAGQALGVVEVIPPGWDRVALPKTKMTVLMPKGEAPAWETSEKRPGVTIIARAMTTSAGQKLIVRAELLEAKEVGAAGAVPEGMGHRALTIGGYPAHMFTMSFGITTYIELGDLKFIYLTIRGDIGKKFDPEVKQFYDSVSFILPPKLGPPAVGN